MSSLPIIKIAHDITIEIRNKPTKSKAKENIQVMEKRKKGILILSLG